MAESVNPYVEWVRAGGDGSVIEYLRHRARLGDPTEKAIGDLLTALAGPADPKAGSPPQG